MVSKSGCTNGSDPLGGPGPDTLQKKWIIDPGKDKRSGALTFLYLGERDDGVGDGGSDVGSHDHGDGNPKIRVAELVSELNADPDLTVQKIISKLIDLDYAVLVQYLLIKIV